MLDSGGSSGSGGADEDEAQSALSDVELVDAEPPQWRTGPDDNGGEVSILGERGEVIYRSVLYSRPASRLRVPLECFYIARQRLSA